MCLVYSVHCTATVNHHQVKIRVSVGSERDKEGDQHHNINSHDPQYQRRRRWKRNEVIREDQIQFSSTVSYIYVGIYILGARGNFALAIFSPHYSLTTYFPDKNVRMLRFTHNALNVAHRHS